MSAQRSFDDSSRWRVRGSRCFYCGALAETDEHWPPRSYSPFGFILPACDECNSFAGTEYPTDLEARIYFVKKKIKQRYLAELSSPEWSPAEVEELGYSLRIMVEAGTELKRYTQGRLEWSPILYLISIDEALLNKTYSSLQSCPLGENHTCDLWRAINTNYIFPKVEAPTLPKPEIVRKRLTFTKLLELGLVT